jgi:4-diphosphocytidyl-2-C-methyl-D-erythritol kinase
VVLPRFPLLQDIKDELRNKGALGCLMSGSGSTVFGIFASEEKASLALGQLDMPPAWQKSMCSGI